jgi:tetratricopeptide (TPR) repeat protein
MLTGCVNTKVTEDRKILHSGYDALNQQNYDGALAASQQFLQENPRGGPGTPEALYLEGRVYEQRALQADTAGQSAQARAGLQAARATYEHALTLKPSRPIAALLEAGIANTAYFQEDYAAAMQNWASAYPDLPQPETRAWVLYRLGLSQQRLGRFEEADQSFQRVRQEYPSSEPAQRAAAHQGARGFYIQIGSFKDLKNADATVSSLQSQGFAALRSTDPAGRQAIRVGPAYNYEQAKSLQARLVGAFPQAMIEP